MKLPSQLLLSLLIAAHIGSLCHGAESPAATLLNARQNFHTILLPQKRTMEPIEEPPSQTFSTVKYQAASGPLAAYLTPDRLDGQKRPAIIWITGGDCNSIGDVWSPSPRNNDQTAGAYRQAGIVMMFPSLRGGNANPGVKEGFLGEVDDVIAAANYLQKLSYIDPKRIYLGAHSTGGTLALLVSECSTLFRAVFAFGPVEDVSTYGAERGFVPVDFKNRREITLRSPGYWLASIQAPTWILEGETSANIVALRAMARISANPKLRFVEVKRASHFDVLAPVNELIARQILRDTNDTCNITLTPNEVNLHFSASQKMSK